MSRVFEAGCKKIIHVNQHVIRANTKNKTNNPPIVVKYKNKSYYGSSIKVAGELQFSYSAHKPLISCGARLIAVTTSKIEIS